MVSLSWSQVNAWRLSQHHLVERADRSQWLDVVRKIGGLHAQLMSAAELSLWARVADLSAADVQGSLWQDRKLVKTWAMRGTLHLLAADEFSLYIGALSSFKHFRRSSWLKYHGVSLTELEALIESVRTTLDGGGLTREQLADVVAEGAGQPKLRDLLRSGWGTLLKPVAFQGYLCFGPSRGQNVTFVQPDKWLGEWVPVESEQALREITRRYLAAYGPATVEDFGRWFGLGPSQVKRLFRSLGDEVEEVEVEGWRAWAMGSSLKSMQMLDAPRSVRLLPNFDPYVVGVARDCEAILPQAHKARIHRPQGWISPVVLVDGRMEGVWSYDKQRSQVAVKVELFGPANVRVKEGIEVEAERLGDFWDADVELVYAD
jgi:hypothetical protein